MVRIVRQAQMDFGTFGIMYLPDSNLALCTVERPWLDNKLFVSCIPTGVYPLVLGEFRRNTDDESDDYPAYEIHEVPGRTNIKIHIANYPHEIEGCVGLGKRFAGGGKWGVADSKVAHIEWMDEMDGIEETELEITWGW